MSRKILLSFIVVLFIIALFIGVFRNAHNDDEQAAQQNTQNTVVSPTLPPSVPQTTLQLFPNPAQPDSEGNIDINVAMDTHNNRTAATQFVIQYDPTALRFVSIHPDDAFYNAKIVTQNVNEATGTITYSLEIPQQSTYPQVSGNYNIAEIEFRAKHSGTTRVKILSASVTSPDSTSSVLKQTADTLVKMNY